jgi:hypothetical protein
VTAAPVVGRLADRGTDRYATGAALLLVVVALVVADLGAGSVVLLGLAAVLLDIGMTSNQVLSQRQIYQLRPDARGPAEHGLHGQRVPRRRGRLRDRGGAAGLLRVDRGDAVRRLGRGRGLPALGLDRVAKWN